MMDDPPAEPLAILGGPKTVEQDSREVFTWPIVTDEDKAAVCEVLDSGNMSGWDITQQFEAEWARYVGTRYALSYPNGTASLLAAMFAVGMGRGDEIIVPAFTYWASALQAFSLGATPVFADIDPESLCIDPADIERHLSSRTRAVMVVHYNGHPADMDRILAVARRHGLKVIEDVSRAQGSLYKGRMCGSMGDVAGISMMSTKSFPIGEGGMLCTNDRVVYERAIAFSHHRRHETELTIEDLKRFSYIPMGGVKGRLNQMCSAMGRVQLKHYPRRIEEIQKAMTRFWGLLENVPGLRAHRVLGSGSTMGGWFVPAGHYIPEELGGLEVSRFIQAVRAEGAVCNPLPDNPLHLHPVFNEADIYHDGKPTRIAFSDRDVRQRAGSLPVCEALRSRSFAAPWFKHDDREVIERHATAYKKVALGAEKLLESQTT